MYQQFLRKFEAQPAIVVFLHMRPLNAPTVSLDERYAVTRAIPTMPACFRVIIRHGYNDIIVNADLARVVFEQVQHFIGRDFSRQIEAEAVVHAQDKLREKLTTELEHLKTAYDTQVVYIVGKEQMRIQPENSFFRKVALAAFLWLRENTRSRIASMRIPVDKLVEVGFIKEL